MNNLCADIGYTSYARFGEELCGDHVEILDNKRIKVVVLADGLGSGVKANILSTLTAKITATMMAEGLSVEECISTIAGTLPVCKDRNAAYSTFTILRISENHEAELIEYDNPKVILLRDGHVCEYPRTDLEIGGKTVSRARIALCEDDTFVAVSDGAIYAGPGLALNQEWKREDVVQYLEKIYDGESTAKMMSARLADKCLSLYGGKPGDDTTACVIRIRRRRPLSLLVGPPESPDDVRRMMSLFFSKEGRHIICGGTTSRLAAEHLGRRLIPEREVSSDDPAIPPTARIEGVDLVTEGAVTLLRTLEYAKDYVGDNQLCSEWSVRTDGASQIARMLFEDATDINLFVGGAINTANRESGEMLSQYSRRAVLDELAQCLRTMGKKVKVSYF